MTSSLLRRLLEAQPTADGYGPGHVYTVPDHLIEFPATPSVARTRHDMRYVVVVQAESLCSLAALKTVQVVPCTTKCTVRPTFEQFLPAGSGGLPEETLALVSITQAIPKADLGDKIGELPGDLLAELLGKVARMHGAQTRIPLQSAAQLPASVPTQKIARSDDDVR